VNVDKKRRKKDKISLSLMVCHQNYKASLINLREILRLKLLASP